MGITGIIGCRGVIESVTTQCQRIIKIMPRRSVVSEIRLSVVSEIRRGNGISTCTKEEARRESVSGIPVSSWVPYSMFGSKPHLRFYMGTPCLCSSGLAPDLYFPISCFGLRFSSILWCSRNWTCTFAFGTKLSACNNTKISHTHFKVKERSAKGMLCIVYNKGNKSKR